MDQDTALWHGLGQGSKQINERAVETATEASMEKRAVHPRADGVKYLDIEYVHRD